MRSSATGLLLLLTAGCGLNDYEDRMLETQAAAERFEADAGLDAALGPPQGNVPDLFFRPPLGQVLVTDKVPPYGATYHYERRPGEKSAVTDVYVTLIGGRPTGTGSAGIEKTLRPPGRDPLLFRQSEFTGVGNDDGSYSRWVLQGLGTTQVTLLYRCEKGRLPEAAALIEKSAGSLALGDDIAASRRTYARWEKGPDTR